MGTCGVWIKQKCASFNTYRSTLIYSKTGLGLLVVLLHSSTAPHFPIIFAPHLPACLSGRGCLLLLQARLPGHPGAPAVHRPQGSAVHPVPRDRV